MDRRQRRVTPSGGVVLAVLVLGGAMVTFPFAWMVLTSLKSSIEVQAYPPTILPAHWNFSNYARAWTTPPSTFGRYLLNSAILAVGGAALQAGTGILAAYALAQMRFPGKAIIFLGFLATMMIPAEVTLIPNFVIIRHIPLLGGNDLVGNGGSGLYNTYLGILLPTGASAFSVFMLRQAFKSLPADYWEAARLDGCGRLRYLVSILAPLAKPAVTTVVLMAVFNQWNQLLWPLVATSSESIRPVQVALIYLEGELGSQFNLMMAAAVMSMLPGVLLYVVAQRQFRESLAFTGLRG